MSGGVGGDAGGGAARAYRGLWAVLVRWFRVPAEPPALPSSSGEVVTSFRPAPGFLRYLKFWFWIALLGIDLALASAWVILLVTEPVGALITLPIFLVVIVVPDVLAYVAVHLRYDTTWYVMTDRSLRIRRGVWIIRETTVTFENVQNVAVRQGPIQRRFGIADLVIETAGGGGGGGAKGGPFAHGKGGSHVGLVEGIAQPEELRDRIMARVRRSASAGLGDEAAAARAGLREPHLAVLREIRDALALARPT